MTDQQRFALRSLYFHARFDDDGAWPAEYRPMPLVQAAGLLAEATGPRAETRRRRAIARLAASPSADLGDPSNAFTIALRELGAPVEQLAADPLLDRRALGPGGRAALRRRIQEALDRLGGPSCAGCEATPAETSISFDSRTQLIVGRSHLRVKRPIDELRRVLDPQNWDRVMPRYFRQACIVAGQGPTYPTTADHAVACEAAPPLPGTSWERVFFEHYALDIGSLFNLVTFKNLLEVRTHATSTSHLVRYQLREVLYGKIGPMEREGGGLDRDDGDATLIDLENGWVEVSATKTFRLDGWKGPLGVDLDFLLNWWTSITIGETLDSIDEAVCRDV